MSNSTTLAMRQLHRHRLWVAMKEKEYERDPELRQREIVKAMQITPEDIAEEHYYKYGTIDMSFLGRRVIYIDYSKEILNIKEKLIEALPEGLFNIYTWEEHLMAFPELKNNFEKGNYLIVYKTQDPLDFTWPYLVEFALEKECKLMMISSILRPTELIIGLESIIKRLCFI